MLDLNNLENLTQKLGKEFIAPYAQEIDQKARFPKEAYEALNNKVLWAYLSPKNMAALKVEILPIFKPATL